MASLVARNLNFIYRSKNQNEDILALNNINLEIGDEEFVVAIGNSGCGKTTLLNLFAGFLSPTEGDIFYSNNSSQRTKLAKSNKNKASPKASLAKNNNNHTIDERITGPGSDRGVVFQRHALLPWLNVIDNASFGLRLQGISTKECIEIAMKNLNLVGLNDFAKHKIYQLSGGMQQRVGIARALTSNPSTLLMDEPLGALDALTRENTQELILKIWKTTKKKVFFITHSVEEALFMATKLIVMSPRPGRITHTFDLDFCHKYFKVKDARKIKSAADFIKMREMVLEIIYSDEKNS